MDVIEKLIAMTKSGQLHWVKHANHNVTNAWTTKNNDVECKLELVYNGDIFYSLKIGGAIFGCNIPKLKELEEIILQEYRKNDQKQLQIQINKFFKDNF